MEGKPDMTPAKNQQPANPEHSEAPRKQGRPVSAEIQAKAKQSWERDNARRRALGEEISVDELRVQKMAWERGGGVPSGAQNPSEDTGEKPVAQEGERVIKDKKAADLIAKYKQEGGRGNIEKTEQLRLNLAQRIKEIEQQQDELGDSPGARTSEGELTPETEKAINELNDQISQIQAFQAEIFQEEQGVEREQGRESQSEMLIRLTNEYVSGLLRRGLKLDEINDLSKLTEQERAARIKIVSGIKEYLANQPKIDTGHFPSNILLAVRHFKELREELISEILFKSFQDDSETNEYEVGLYAASNLDILLGFVSIDDPKRYKELFTLRTATRFFQTMNATVIKGTFDSFGHAAENINYQHFENMRDVRGSGLAMRLFEQAYKDELAASKRVTQDKIAGIKEHVETTFREINEAGQITSEFARYRENGKMEDWEIQRALAAGRTFFNITLRAAENIATGQVPTDRKRYTSPPQEDMVRILNWNQWLLARFTVGGGAEGRHGEEFLKKTTDKYQDFLRYKGAKLGVNKITEFGGVDVRKMEDGSQYKTSGVYSGWRSENMAFNEITFDYNGRRFTVQEFRDQSAVKDRVKEIKDRIERRKTANPNADPKDLVTEEDQREYKDVLMPVVNNLNFGLSMLLKNGDFGVQDNKLGYLLREAIWKRIASTNTPLMVDYLTDLQYEWDKLNGEDGIGRKLEKLAAKEKKSAEEDAEEARLKKERDELIKRKADTERDGLVAKSLEQLRSESGEVWKDKEKWEKFKNKILVRFERTIRERMMKEGEVLSPLDSAKYKLDSDEKNMEDAIKREAAKLAPHLADIIFPYTPFMNDMPFEEFQYDYLGQTFYKRRTTGDLGGYNKGQNAYTKILSNPGGIPAKDAVQAMGEIVAGVEGPEGPRTGIESNFPTFNALLDVVTTDPGKRQAMFKMLLEATRKETSIAQRWQGIKADSFTEAEAANLVDDALRAGILTPELARYLKKEKHLTLPFILWMLFRDVFILMPVYSGSALWDATKTK